MSNRDENGLLINTIYPRKESGLVNWRAMLLPEHLYVNPDHEKPLMMQFGVTSRRHIDVTKVEDSKLLVNLAGWRHLLRLRGFTAVRFNVDPTAEKVTAVCSIDFTPNFETGGIAQTWSESGNGSLYNVSGKFQLYLETQATNRAFARCVRTYLEVPIYGFDEFDAAKNAEFEEALKSGVNPLIAPKVEPVTSTNPDLKAWERVRTVATQKGFTFEQVRASAQGVYDKCQKDPEFAKVNRLNLNPADWIDFSSIDGLDAYTILDLMAKAEKKGKK